MNRFLLLILTFCCLSIAFAQTAVQPDGEGTAESPFLIESLNNLYWFSQTLEHFDKHYLQTQDIDASETILWNNGQGWDVISQDSTFSGIYDGDNHKIINLYTIKPITADSTGTYPSACFLPNVNNATIKNIIFENITLQANNSGLINWFESSIILNVHVSGNIEGGNRTAGLINFPRDSLIKNCSFTGSLRGIFVGGLVSECRTGTTIEDSYADIDILSRYPRWAGGLIAEVSSSFELPPTIKNSYSKGQVRGYYAVGGLVGSGAVIIENCYSLCDVSGFNYVGGLVGQFGGGSITNSYASAKLYGHDIKGGIIGGTYAVATVTNSFWNTTLSGITESDYGVGLTDEEMKNATTFLNAGWDFEIENIWSHSNLINDSYPHLSMEISNLKSSASIKDYLNITHNSITVNCALSTLIDDNANSYGLVWSTNPNFDLNNSSYQNFIISESLEEVFVEIPNLAPNTLYYIKTFVLDNNSEVISYSLTNTFNTMPIEIIRPNGQGTIDNPYQISNLNNLLWFSQNKASWSSHFIQTADIDASNTETWFINKYYEILGWEPIGNYDTYFNGSYNGQHYKISGLYINNIYYAFSGLFGYLDRINEEPETIELKNIILENVRLSGYKYSGLLAGYTKYTSVERCSVQGTMETHLVDYNGGLVGKARFSSFNECVVRLDSQIGIHGLFIGEITDNCTIDNSYASGVNSRDVNTSLFVQSNSFLCEISNCYSLGMYNDTGYETYNVFYNANVINSFWDMELSNIEIDDPPSYYATTEEMTNPDFYISHNWDFENVWTHNPDINDGYPYLQWQNLNTNSQDITIPELLKVKLHSAYPNPFNPETNIMFDISKQAKVRLEIFNIKGQKVKTLIDNTLHKGNHSIVWNGKNNNSKSMPSGVYFYKLDVDNHSEVKKLVLIK